MGWVGRKHLVCEECGLKKMISAFNYTQDGRYGERTYSEKCKGCDAKERFEALSKAREKRKADAEEEKARREHEREMERRYRLAW